VITIAEMLELERFKSFKCLAGNDGLNQLVEKISLLDYEIVEQVDNQFFEHEFALSSLLGAKNKPELIISAVEYLHKSGVIGLGVKNIYYDTLPEEVIRYSNEEKFPLFIFDNSVFFEDLITDLRDVLRDMDMQKEWQVQLELLLKGDFSERERNKLFIELTDYYDKTYLMLYLENKSPIDNVQHRKIIESFRQRKVKTIQFFIPFRSGYLMCYDASAMTSTSLSSDCNYLGLQLNDFQVGLSVPAIGVENFKLALDQCLWAYQVSKCENVAMLTYDDIGVYKLLQHIVASGNGADFVAEIIEPLKEYDREHGTELFLTAKTFVESDGLIINTSKALFQHSNTTRYRMNKIKQVLGYEHKEGSFFEALSMAFRLYKILE